MTVLILEELLRNPQLGTNRGSHGQNAQALNKTPAQKIHSRKPVLGNERKNKKISSWKSRAVALELLVTKYTQMHPPRHALIQNILNTLLSKEATC